MSGHSKWSQIKRQKGANDVARSAMFGTLARRIAIESKKAGGDVTSPSLRASIEKARKENVPKENIERAVAKGTSLEATSLEGVVYETYGHGGVAIIISALTDNKNKISAEIKYILSKNELELASAGSALWAFEKTENGYTPKNTISISEEDRAKLLTVLHALKEHEDVEDMYTNADMVT